MSDEMIDTGTINPTLIRLVQSQPTFLIAPPTFTHQSSRAVVLVSAREKVLAGLQLALEDGQVCAAITGPKHSGKSEILQNTLEAAKAKSRVCVFLRSPDTICNQSVGKLEQAIQSAVMGSKSQLENVLIAVDNAHIATNELLHFLTVIVGNRHCPIPVQIVLVGQLELWSRLECSSYGDLRRRLAIRYEMVT